MGMPAGVYGRPAKRILTAEQCFAGCRPPFTLGELQHVYEATWGRDLERANFRRKVLTTAGFVQSTGRRRIGRGGGAPAIVYRAGTRSLLVPPLTRPGR